MSFYADDQREAIHESLQEIGLIDGDPDQAKILTKWALVTEWIDEDGERWLSRTQSESTKSWDANGFWFEALYGNWPADEE